MIDKKEAAPAVGTANGMNENKGTVNLKNIKPDDIKFIRVYTNVLQKDDAALMEAVKNLYLGGLVEGVKNKMGIWEYTNSDDDVTAVILEKYLPYSNEELIAAHDQYDLLIKESEGQPHGFIPVKIWEAYRNETGDKLLPFRMFVALKSIIGRNKPYARITHRFLLCRMAGYAKPTTENGFDKKTFEDNPKLYLSGYRRRMTVEYLERFWGLSSYYVKSIKGGTYYSFELARKELIKLILQGGAKARHIKLQAERKADEEAAYLEVFGTPKECRERKPKQERNEEQDDAPIINNEQEPEAEAEADTTIQDDLVVSWLAMANTLQTSRPLLADTMRNNHPVIQGRKAILKVKNQAQKQYFEETELFIHIWSQIKASIKQYDLNLVAVVED